MGLFIRIYVNERIEDVELEGKDSLSIGSSQNDDVIIYDANLNANHIQFYKQNGRWFVSYLNENKMSFEKEIANGDIFRINNGKAVAISVIANSSELIKEYELLSKERISIGRNPNNNIVLDGKNISRIHAVLFKTDGTWSVSDNHSSNGTFINGKKILSETNVYEGDVIVIGNYSITFFNERLLVGINGKDEEKNDNFVYPYKFTKSPRLVPILPTEKVDISNPPQEQNNRVQGIIRSIGTPLIMIIAIGVMVYISGSSARMLIITVPMSIFSIAVAIGSMIQQKKAKRDYEAKRQNRFGEYIKSKEKRILELKKEQENAMNIIAPSINECIQYALKMTPNLWCRDSNSNEFMQVKIGNGTVKASFEIKVSEEGFRMDDDALLSHVYEVAKGAKYLENAPISINLKEDKHVGIIGKRYDERQLINNILVHLTALQGYDDLKIVFLYSRKTKEDWSWIRWLPHVYDDSRQSRFIVSSKRGADSVLAQVEEVLKERKAHCDDRYNNDNYAPTPFYLFVFTETEMLEDVSIMQYLNSNANLGTAAIYMLDNIGNLPANCNRIIEVVDGKGYTFLKNSSSDKQAFSVESIDNKTLDYFARKLAPIRLPNPGGEKGLPVCVTFFEGYGVKNPQEFNVISKWNSGYTYESMSVPIGVLPNGAPFFFDIHEKRFGPHGMVAGMTGSGKSEMIQSWILSMALKFSPRDVSFVLIDFKGTGLILPFNKLPHLAGTISDLDKNIGRNLIALENELSRRKELLDKYGVNNINKYLKLYHSGKASEPCSYLFVIIDEFAEFKVQFPDFMPVVDRIFAIGRTLGVFIILLTQKPAGVVDDKMNANTRFRWCLKVASSSDSKDMLKHPDAAKITVPGRAYVQVGEDEVYEMIQTYYSGAPYSLNEEERSTIGQNVCIVDENGRRTFYGEEEYSQIYSNKSEIETIVDYLEETVKGSNEFEKARQIWMPKLESIIYSEDIENQSLYDGGWHNSIEEHVAPIIGIVDDPALQKQYPLRLDFTENGHYAVYGSPGTGKTTLLHTAIMSMVKTYAPDFVNIYAMDFGSWSLGIFKDYPHVGGVVNDSEEELIEKLVGLIDKQFNVRKEKFSKVGAGNIRSYMDISGELLPTIVLVVDNFTAVSELYPEYDDFFIKLTRDGGKYGVYLLATTTSVMGIKYRISQNIKMSLALNMSDRSDYQSIVGRTNGFEPENVPGRGLVKNNPPLEFQTCLPLNVDSERDRIKEIMNLAQEMKRNWRGNSVKRLPVLPDIIPFDSVEKDNEHGIVLGLNVNDMTNIYLPANRKHYNAILGFRNSGKTNMLMSICKQYIKDGDVTIYYCDISKSSEEIKGRVAGYYSSAVAFDELMEELVPELQSRLEKREESAEITFNPIVLFLDDYHKLYKDMSDMSSQRLANIIYLANGLNVHIYIASDADQFKALYLSDKVSNAISNENSAILLGEKLNMFEGIRVNNVHINEKSSNVGKYEGFLVENGVASRFMAMCCR